MSARTETYYVKRGRHYSPAGYQDYDRPVFPAGSHLIQVDGNQICYRYNIEPQRVALLAAMLESENDLARLIVQTSHAQPQPVANKSISPELSQAWSQLLKQFGSEFCMVQYPSAADIGRNTVQALAERIIPGIDWSRPAVQKAWEQFALTASLSAQPMRETE